MKPQRLIAALALGTALALSLVPIAVAQQPAPAPAAEREPMSPEAEQRLRKLSEELRCLVCQNQTLADSNADLAVDLRRQVETMVAAGKSDAVPAAVPVEHAAAVGRAVRAAAGGRDRLDPGAAPQRPRSGHRGRHAVGRGTRAGPQAARRLTPFGS